MPKQINRLSADLVKNLADPGVYPDGEGLYLQITPSGSKSWFYRYKFKKKERRQGLGPYPTISLELARKKAKESKILRVSGFDPIELARLKEFPHINPDAQIEAIRFNDKIVVIQKNGAFEIIEEEDRLWLRPITPKPEDADS